MKKLSNVNGDFEYELLDENQQDADLRKKLTDLYSSPYSDILRCELHDPSIADSHCYKLYYYEQSVLIHLLLFKYSAESSKKIMIINEQFRISTTNIENICNILFQEFKKVKEVIFKNIYEPSSKKSSNMNVIFDKTSNDVIIDLPESMDEYFKLIGKMRHKDYKRCVNNIVRDFPDFTTLYYVNNDIHFEQINKMKEWKKDRMDNIGRKNILDDDKSAQIYEYSRINGVLSACENKGEIIGGSISWFLGKHAYSPVTSYDVSYGKYSIGNTLFVIEIKYLIEEKKIKYFHLGDGFEEYKFRFGGINHDLYTVHIYRNAIMYSLKKMVNMPIALKKYIYSEWRENIIKKLKKNKKINQFYYTIKQPFEKIRISIYNVFHK